MATKICPTCEKEFQIKKFVRTTAFCSRKCASKHNNDKRTVSDKTAQIINDVDEFIKAARA